MGTSIVAKTKGLWGPHFFFCLILGEGGVLNNGRDLFNCINIWLSLISYFTPNCMINCILIIVWFEILSIILGLSPFGWMEGFCEKRKEMEGKSFLSLVWMVKEVREGENQEPLTKPFLFLIKSGEI